MISLRRPSPDVIDRYLREVSATSPTHLPGDPADDMTVEHHAVACGSGEEVWDRGRAAVSSWVAQRGSGMSVTPSHAPVVGATVVVATRQAGLWVLAPCRVVEVFDEPRRAGFTYATLPGHPERGIESFTVNRNDAGEVTFDIDVVFEPATLLARLSGPIGHWLQRRGTRRYLDAVSAHCRA
ncbi:MAG: DUF1990 family protein [Acidimicrobiales bacterium]